MNETETQLALRYIRAELPDLQRQRIVLRANLTLEALFCSVNPYHLRATYNVVPCLMSHVYERYTVECDEQLFAELLQGAASYVSRELSCCHSIENGSSDLHEKAAFTRLGIHMPHKGIIDLFAYVTLPHRAELAAQHDRNLTRLMRQFYQQLCTDDAAIDWQRLIRFISKSDSLINANTQLLTNQRTAP
ncbi:MAG: hypothetical protein OXE46_00075 [Chloroflexi bacterium]|nr:hypothetical protein [Chloroflexota bacterium]